MFVNSLLGLYKGHFTIAPLQMQLSHCSFIAPLISGLCTYVLKSLYRSGTHYFSSSINTDRESEENETSSREAQDHQEHVGTAYGALEHMRGLNFDLWG